MISLFHKLDIIFIQSDYPAGAKVLVASSHAVVVIVDNVVIVGDVVVVVVVFVVDVNAVCYSQLMWQK